MRIVFKANILSRQHLIPSFFDSMLSYRVECWAGPKFDAGSAQKVVIFSNLISFILFYRWTTVCVHRNALELQESLVEDKE